MAAVYPTFRVDEVVRTDGRVTFRGSVSPLTVGRETWVGDRSWGYLKHGDQLIEGRWRRADEAWEFCVESPERLDALPDSSDLEVLDGYWGMRAELVLDRSLAWVESDWDDTDGDHAHCSICWATISRRENRRHHHCPPHRRVCAPCHERHVEPCDLSFIPTLR